MLSACDQFQIDVTCTTKKLFDRQQLISNKKAFQWDVYRPLANLCVLVTATRCQYWEVGIPGPRSGGGWVYYGTWDTPLTYPPRGHSHPLDILTLKLVTSGGHHWRHTHPLEHNGRHLWKHYLNEISLTGGKKWNVPLCLMLFDIPNR